MRRGLDNGKGAWRVYPPIERAFDQIMTVWRLPRRPGRRAKAERTPSLDMLQPSEWVAVVGPIWGRGAPTFSFMNISAKVISYTLLKQSIQLHGFLIMLAVGYIDQRLGNSGLKILKHILGCMTFGSSKWECLQYVLDEEQSLKVMKVA